MRNNRKGFTIVELVIVIAVIAILAGVLIPTFSGIIKKAQASAAQQEVVNAYKEAYALALSDDGVIYTDADKPNTETENIGGTDQNPDWTFEFTNADGVISVKVTKAPGKYDDYKFDWNKTEKIIKVTEKK